MTGLAVIDLEERRAEAEARVTELAAVIPALVPALQECDRLGGNGQQAFLAGLPPAFLAGLVRAEPMLGALFMALGVPVEA